MFLKVMSLINAGILILYVIFLFVMISRSHSSQNNYFYFIWSMRAIYLLLFAAFFIACEAAPTMRRWFYFMNFGWGKGLALISMLSF